MERKSLGAVRRASTMEENKTLTERLIAYYEENSDDFADDIEYLDEYKGVLYDDRRIPMDELDEVLNGKSASEIIGMVRAGSDDEGDTFNPNRNYFYYDGYGNLVSTDDRDYSDYLDADIVDQIIEFPHRKYISSGAQDVIDQYEEEQLKKEEDEEC